MLRLVALSLALAPLGGCDIRPLPDAGVGDAGPPSRVISIDDFDRRCRVDADCAAGLVGDVCACACDWAGFAASDARRFDQTFLRIAMTCAELPDCDCDVPFIWCDGGTCQAREGPGPCGCPEGTVCTQRYDGRCGGGSPVCVAAPAACAADPGVAAGRRICEPECELELCGATSSCRPPGALCGGRGGQPERAAAVHCYAP